MSSIRCRRSLPKTTSWCTGRARLHSYVSRRPLPSFQHGQICYCCSVRWASDGDLEGDIDGSAATGGVHAHRHVLVKTALQR
jgi:hypothetical protein